jgi:hypothetical protein
MSNTQQYPTMQEKLDAIQQELAATQQELAATQQELAKAKKEQEHNVHSLRNAEIEKKQRIIDNKLIVMQLSAFVGICACLIVWGMVNILPQTIMCIFMACMSAILLQKQKIISNMRYNATEVVDNLIVVSSALMCVITASAFAVLMPFLGGFAFGACVAYVMYVVLVNM